MTENSTPNNCYDILPEDVKEYLETHSASPKVIAEIFEAFSMSKEYRESKISESIKELTGKINKNLKYTGVNSFEEYFITKAVNAGKIEYEKTGYGLGNITIKHGEKSMIIKFTTDCSPGDGNYISYCNYFFNPNDIDIEEKLKFIQEFNDLLLMYYFS